MFAWPSKNGTQLSEPITLAVATFMLSITIIFYGLSSADNSNKYGFKYNLKEYYRGKFHFDHATNTTVRDGGYPVQMSPPMWGYSVAIVFLFIWQCIWMLYGWSFLFRPRVPKVIPMAAYLLFSAAVGLIIVRLYLYANGHVNPGLACQIILTALLMATLGLAHFLMYYRTYQLNHEGWVVDKWLTRIIVHNGLAMLIAWEVLELLVCMNITMEYNSGKVLKAHVASAATLVTYIILVTIWLILETTILDQFMRHTLFIYPVFMWFFATALIEQWDHHAHRQTVSNNFLVTALGYTVMIQICRIVFLVYFRISRPLEWPQPRPNMAGYRRIHHLQY